MLAVLSRRRPRLIVTMGIITDTDTMATTIGITTAGITTVTGFGSAPSTVVRGTIATGEIPAGPREPRGC